MKDNRYYITKANLIAQITAVYHHKENMLEQDRSYFQKTLAEWDTCSVSEMTSWLLANIPFVNYCRKVTHTQEDFHTKDIQHFMIGDPTTKKSKP
eukprot:5496081-Ditylum_brightwellii.AAC.1